MEKPTRRSKAAHRDPPAIVPEALLAEVFVCDKCGSHHSINWFEKQAFPKESIASNDGRGHWVPVSFLNTCGNCSEANDVRVKTTKTKASILISADEASRDLNDIHYFLIAGCSISPDSKNITESRIGKLEKRLCAESNGVINHFHAKDIMDQRVWANATLTQRLKYIKQMCKIA